MSAVNVTVEEFLWVREKVAQALKEDSSTQVPTRVRQAENLMRDGFIDMAAVLERRNPTTPAEQPADPTEGAAE
ncbi:MAG: hypothetical protein K0Q52_196 [Microbacterium sp.]|nr:hypothetical protein [Microbacterium sp.]